MIKKTAIIDYGMGNLYSVRNSFAALGMDTDTVGRGCDLGRYDKLILPGVGAFGDAMKEGVDRAYQEFCRCGASFDRDMPGDAVIAR